jgi:hypothetical protein
MNSDKAADLAAIGPLCDQIIARHPLAANLEVCGILQP